MIATRAHPGCATASVTSFFSTCDFPAPAAAFNRMRSTAAVPASAARSTSTASSATAALPAAASAWWTAAVSASAGGVKARVTCSLQVVEGQVVRRLVLRQRHQFRDGRALRGHLERVLVEDRRPHLRVQLTAVAALGEPVGPVRLRVLVRAAAVLVLLGRVLERVRAALRSRRR